VQKAQDLEEGIIKKSWENVQRFIAEQDAKTATAKEELAAKRLKLDMTPAQSAGYDASRASYKDSDKQIADATARLNRLLEAGASLESKSVQGAIRDLDALREARERNANDAAAMAMKEAEFQREYATGWKTAYKSWSDDATNAAKLASESFNIATNAMENAIDQFLTTGKINFAEFAKSVILSIAKIEARMLLAQSLKGEAGSGTGLMGMLLGFLGMGSGSGITGSTIPGVMVNGIAGGPLSGAGLHEGGIAGLEATFLRNVPAHIFANAPKFHSGGIAANEVPAILQKGEGVFTAKQMKAMGGGGQPINITVHVNGNASAPDVRRSMAQGAREAFAMFNNARRYA
jgi:lambda family phage tail tape measure protein